MHERKTLMIRNPGRPTMERLPCRLTRDEKLARMDRTDAIERTIEQHEAEIAAIKAKAKAAVDEVQTKVADLQTERKKVRNERIAGFEERLVECELLEDAGEGVLYVFRLDTLEVAQRRDMAPHEQRELQLEGRSSRTVDIPDDVASVVRFDSDPPGTGDEEDDDGEEGGGTYGHEHEYNEGACITCGEVDPDAEPPAAEATKPKRRKRGEGKGSKGYDTRAAH